MGKTSVAVLLVGNEILQARVVEENFVPIVHALMQKGIVVSELRVVQDEKIAIAKAAQELSALYSYVICAGGIGPTHDDITFGSIAFAFDCPLEKNKAMMDFLLSRNKTMNEGRAKMALLPRKSTLLQHAPHAWPVVCFRNMFILPGLPPVLRAILPALSGALPQEAQLYYGYLVVREKEQNFAAKLGAVQKEFPDVAIGSYPSFGTSLVKISLTSVYKETADRCFQVLESYFGSRVEEHQLVEALEYRD